MKKKLSEEDKEYIRKYYKIKTNVELAKLLNCDKSTINYWTKRLGLSKGQGFFDKHSDKYLRDNLLTKTIVEIAKHYGCHTCTVSSYIRQQGMEMTLPRVIVLSGIEYRKVTDTVHVSRDGQVLKNGKPAKVTVTYDTSGRKHTALCSVSEGGKRYHYQLSRLVAKGWLRGYSEDKYILYKDGDIHNVSADNLILTNAKRYTEFLQRNSGYKAADAKERIRKLQLVIDEASITQHYLQTGDLSRLGTHVKDYLYPVLIEFCVKKLYLGREKSATLVPDCIACLYELVMNGACIYNYERYCKKMLQHYKKNGSFGHLADVPKPIKIIVQQLNFDCLWERYKVKYIS